MVNILQIETFEEGERTIPYSACLDILKVQYKLYYFNKEDIIERVLQIIVDVNLENYLEIFVHNLNFDGILIIEYLTRSKFFFKIKALNAEIYWITVEHVGKRILFRCSYKIIPLTVEKMANIGLIERKPFPRNFVKKCTLGYKGAVPEELYWESERSFISFKSNNTNIPPFDLERESIINCGNNLRIIKTCLMELLKILNDIDKTLIKTSFSAPSISHKLFFKNFNQKNIEKKIHEGHDTYARSSYKGGRCEIFGNPYQGEIIKYFDFPGMYGSCMKEKFHYGKGVITSKSDLNVPGFHTITYKSLKMNIPIIPSHSANNKLLFANGENTECVWFEEILYFVKNGGIILKKHHSLIYEKFDEVFSDFVNLFTDIRQKGGYYNIFGKLMINSLYGGMGLRNEKLYNYITFSGSEFEFISKKLNVKNFYKLNEVYIIIIEMDYKFKAFFKDKIVLERSNRNVTYAAAISAKARIKLHKLMIKVENDGGRVLYADTDSVFAAYKEGDRRKYLGDLKWTKEYRDAVFISSKTYGLVEMGDRGEILKIQGSSAKNLNFNTLKESFYENKGVIINGREGGLGLEKGVEGYSRRIFSLDKKKTLPWEINNTDI